MSAADETEEHYDVVISSDPSTAKIIRESWYKNCALHRVGGPAQKVFDRVKGTQVAEAWYEDQLPHRKDGPRRDKRSNFRILGSARVATPA